LNLNATARALISNFFPLSRLSIWHFLLPERLEHQLLKRSLPSLPDPGKRRTGSGSQAAIKP
jgi:hypothetical protein